MIFQVCPDSQIRDIFCSTCGSCSSQLRGCGQSDWSLDEGSPNPLEPWHALHGAEDRPWRLDDCGKVSLLLVQQTSTCRVKLCYQGFISIITYTVYTVYTYTLYICIMLHSSQVWWVSILGSPLVDLQWSKLCWPSWLRCVPSEWQGGHTSHHQWQPLCLSLLDGTPALETKQVRYVRWEIHNLPSPSLDLELRKKSWIEIQSSRGFESRRGFGDPVQHKPVKTLLIEEGLMAPEEERTGHLESDGIYVSVVWYVDMYCKSIYRGY